MLLSTLISTLFTLLEEYDEYTLKGGGGNGGVAIEPSSGVVKDIPAKFGTKWTKRRDKKKEENNLYFVSNVPQNSLRA
jgi:hypothetical protein